MEKRIGELIAADRYLNRAEKEYYPEYQRLRDIRNARGKISEEFRSIISDYKDFVQQTGDPDRLLDRWYLVSCATAFSIGDKKMHARVSEGDFILPMMRDAMQTIIGEQTHLTERCEAMLEALNGPLAAPLEPTEAELNPPPPPKKEYVITLGTTVFLGAQEYEVLAYDDKEVRLYDLEFPLFNKEMSREEFEQRLAENPQNDHLLQVVEEAPEITEQPETEADLDSAKGVVIEQDKEQAQMGSRVDEMLRQAELAAQLAEQTGQNVFAFEEGSTAPVTVPAEEETALPPPPESKPREKVSPFILHPEVPTADRHDYRITDDAIGVGTPGERFNNNVRAIRLLKKLEEENRFATPEEQEVLAKYVGWGGLADCFDERHSKYAELKSLLTDDEYQAARESTLTAFYTPPVVIRAMYQALENMNFKTGNVLEPSCGIGNFIGMRPDSLADTKIYGIELDSISGRIARQLYQKSSIAVQGFEKTDLPDSFFDVAIGNIPFGSFKVPDKRYDKYNFLIHDYFFARTLDKVRPGGIVAFITSKGTMDKETASVRKYIAQRAELIGAIRLPNNTFKSAAGTEVTSDILFFQKRDRLTDITPDWVYLNTAENGLKMNQYFVDNLHMIMGEMQEVSGPYGPETACLPREGQDLGAMLTEAIGNIQAEIPEYEMDDPEAAEEDRSIPADPYTRNFSYTIVDGTVYYRENSRMNPVEVSATAESRIKGLVGIRDGYKYNDCKESYRLMRKVSDRLCREHSLSVIEESCGKSRHYSEWSAEENGKPTYRGTIREDIGRAISASTTSRDFIRVMTEMGYEIKTHGESGTPLKYPSLKPPGAKGYFRFHKLGEGYSLDEIKERILQNYRKKIPFPEVKPKRGRRYRYHGSRRAVKKATGLRALYLRYCYELHIIVRHPASVKRVSFLLREDVVKLDRFIAQTWLLGKQRIETYEDLCNYKAYLEGQISTLTAERNSLRNQLKRASRQNDGIAADEIKKQIASHTAMLKAHRRELTLCDSIEQRSAQVRENLEQLCREREQERKEQETNDPIRRCGGSSRPIDVGRR